MKLSFANDRILAVMAHPDDAELLCAGTLARARDDGAGIGMCVMCRGEKGAGSATGAVDLGAIRREEAEAAARMLGAELYWQDHPDGELFDTYPARLKLVATLRRFRPTLVIAHAGEDYHPDHLAASTLAEAATWFAASRGHVTAQFTPLDTPPSLWWADTVNMAGFEPGFYLDITDHVGTKKRMLDCHRSQSQRGRDGDLVPLAELMARQMEARGAQAGVAAAECFRALAAFKRLRAW
ncbi:MAG TPA: PIG-L deacetylase family protein [Tepidisphaeraceae bacterium]|nr:PIG-L deacetylase family protein [Tepidisphaeraceae bacterium]